MRQGVEDASGFASAQMALEHEIKTYQRELNSLLEHQGKYVLIHKDEVNGIYDTYADALKAGYEKYELAPFLIKRIEAVEEIQSFTRAVEPCPI